MSERRQAVALAASPLAFVLSLGVVNLLADMTYEGGAAVNGQFLGSLGASAAAISIIAGVGEFLGYSLRSVAGYIADKTKRYWLVTFIGYGVNLFAVPAMALAGHWQFAAVLILAERIGRAIRKPTIEAMLSYSTGKLGKGWVYALNTAMDETGATLGPLIAAIVLMTAGGTNYRAAYGTLLISSLLAIVALTTARAFFPAPSRLEVGSTATAKGFDRKFWLHMIAASFFGAGLMSFELVSFHLARSGIVTDYWIPLFLSISTGFGVLASLLLGRLYDRLGMPVVIAAVTVSSCFSPFIFLGNFSWALFGMLLWGIGYAVQDTLLKAVVAGLLPEGRRSSAFGLFYTGYGVGWLVGSIVTGLLYDRSVPLLIGFAMTSQLLAVPLFFLASKHRNAVNPRASPS